MRQCIIQFFFYTLPLGFAMWLEQPGLVGAALVVAVIPYIKVQKLRSQLVDAEEQGSKLRSEDLRKLLARWEYIVPKKLLQKS